MACTLEDTISLFSNTTAGNRDLETVTRLANSLQNDFLFFKNIKISQVEGIVQCGTVEKISPGTTVIIQGEEGRKFFVLLSGKMCVYKVDKRKLAANRLVNKSRHHMATVDPKNPRALQTLKEANFQKKHGRFLTSILPGECFGELALLEAEGKRHATVICTKDSHVLSLSRASFLHFLSDETLKMGIKRCVEILCKPPRERTKDDLFHVETFVSNCDFLQQLEPQIRLKLIAEFTYQAYEAGQYLFFKGDPPDGFYVVLTGLGAVYAGERIQTTETANNQQSELIAALKPGDAFGERGLIYGTNRTASVKAELRLTCMCLSNGAYERLLKPLMSGASRKGQPNIAVNLHLARESLRRFPEVRTEREIQAIQTLLKTLPFFKQLPSAYVMKLAKSVLSRRYSRNDPIMLQGDHGSEFYIILEGTVSVMIHNTRLKLQKMNDKINKEMSSMQNEMETIPFVTNHEQVSFCKNGFTRTVETALKESFPSSNIDNRFLNIGKLKESESFAIYGKCVANLGRGDSFGEANIISGNPRGASVIPREDVELVVVSKGDYENIIKNCSVVFDPKSCLKALGREPSCRTREDIESIATYCKTMPFFRSIPSGTVYTIASVLRLVKAQSRQLILTEGDPISLHSGHLFVLIKGSVSVHTLHGNGDSTQKAVGVSSKALQILYHKCSDSTKRYIPQTEVLDDLVYNLHNVSIQKNTKGKKKTLKAPQNVYMSTSKPVPTENIDMIEDVIGTCQAILSSGDTFGSIAPGAAAKSVQESDESITERSEENKVPKRSASIMTREKSEFLVVDGKEFLKHIQNKTKTCKMKFSIDALQRQCAERSKEDMKTVLDLALRVKFFQQMPSELIREFCDETTLICLEAEEVLCEEGVDDTIAFWIILEGELIVYKRNFEKRVSLTKCDSFEEATIVDDGNIYEENVSFGGIDADSKQAGNRGLCVGMVQAGDVVGESTLFKKYPRSATLVANGQVKALQLSRSAFFKNYEIFEKRSSFLPRETFEVIRRASESHHSLHGVDKILRSVFKIVPSLRSEHISASELKYFGVVHKKSGDQVYGWREPSDCFYILLKGSVKLYDTAKGKFITRHRDPGTYLGATSMLLNCNRSFSCFAHGNAGAYLLVVDRQGFRHLHGDNMIISHMIRFINERQILGKGADEHDVALTIEMIKFPPIHLARGANLLKKIIYEATPDCSSSSDDDSQEILNSDMYFLLTGELSIKTAPKTNQRPPAEEVCTFHSSTQIESGDQKKIFLSASPLRHRRHNTQKFSSLLQAGSVFSIDSNGMKSAYICTSQSAVVAAVNMRKLKNFLRPSAYSSLQSTKAAHVSFQNARYHSRVEKEAQDKRGVSRTMINGKDGLIFMPAVRKLRNIANPTTTMHIGETAINYAKRMMSLRRQCRQLKRK